MICVSFSLGHTFCSFPPSTGPSSTPGILPYEWQRDGVTNRSASPVPTPPPQALGFQNNSLFTNFSKTNLCEHIQLANNVLQGYAQLWRNISPFQGCGEGLGRGSVAGMPPKPSASPESSLLLHLICSVSEE